MNTRQYYYLTTISQYGNLTHAAKALQVSPSALSKFLAECENTFGFALFLRYGRKLYPTAVGRYVVECAQKILDEQNRMLLTMKEVTGGNRDRIRLATAPNRGAIIFSRIYNQFSRRYPGISLTLTELYAKEQPGAIARGRIDLALGAGVPAPEVTNIPIAYEELLVSLPVSHPLAGQEKIRLRDLRDTPFVLQGPQHSIRVLAERLFQEAGFQPVVAFESSDVLLADSMMHQAVGVGLVSKAHVFPCPELTYRPLDPPVYQTLHLRYPLGHILTEPERFLAGLLVKERLVDPRYQAIDDPKVEGLLHAADAPEGEAAARPVDKALENVREINLDSRILEYLIAIVEERSLSRAADRCFLAQSALSRHLRGVEEMVGMALFTREHNRLRPTSAGTIFVNNARNMLRIENEMFATAKTYRAGHGGHLYICCDPIVTKILRSSVTQDFRRMHPDITLVVNEANQAQTLEALLSSSADIGVCLSTTPKHPLLHCDVLGLTELVYCFSQDTCPPDLLPGDPLPADLPPHPQLLAEAGTTLRTEQEAILEQLFPSLPPVACQAQLPILRELANLGCADTVIPLNLLRQAQHCRCAALDPPKPLYLLLARHVGRTLPAPAQDLYALIRDSLSDVLDLPNG